MMHCRIRSFFFVAFAFVIPAGCNEDEQGSSISRNIIGQVQKGPYTNGTIITLSELKSTLEQTGRTFSTEIASDNGSFEMGEISLNSKYVELLANGFYFNEVEGGISAAPLTLHAVANVEDTSRINVNILTHLERPRIVYLVAEENETFEDAKQTAQAEVLAAFGFDPASIDNSEMLDISTGTEGSAILLAMSIVVQGNRSVGDVTELLATLSGDLREDGVLTDGNLMEQLRISAIDLNLEAIRENLTDRYEELGQTVVIPAFEAQVEEFLVFTAEEPSPVIHPATIITTESATLNGTVNPNSLSTTVTFEYGTTTGYGSTSAASQSPLMGESSIPVSSEIVGLSPGTTYHFRIKAENSQGVTFTEGAQFTTRGEVPTIVSYSLNQRTNGAIIHAKINANEVPAAVTLEWGTTTAYGNVVTSPNLITGNAIKTAAIDIQGLAPGVTYHARIVAENAVGAMMSEDITFETLVPISDIEGNTYNVVKIGSQIWMAENLKTTKLNDGTSIPNPTPWASETMAYCFFDNQDSNKDTYGMLYNFPAVKTNKLCPTGWHVSSAGEWDALIGFFGAGTAGHAMAGGKLKVTGTSFWNSPNTGATNEVYFAALPGGYREHTGTFTSLSESAYFWTSTQDGDGFTAFGVRLDHNDEKITTRFYSRPLGLSVRCVKD